MRIAHNDISLVKGYHTARTEAEKAFGNSAVYIEKFIENPHHIEFQILGDSRGKIIHLGERDCSVQRRNQKVVEETPSPMLENPKFKGLRKDMGKAAIRIAEAAHYTNAGTVEFVVDDKGNYYFLEVNKRIQVEHPITEEVTGIDLVRQQILIASGEPLKISQSDVEFKGHSIECRINAEDPFDEFRPSPGRIEMYYQPGGRGVRVDTHAYAGYTIPPHYDSMIGKLITYGKDRREAMDKMSPRVERIHDHRRQDHDLIPAGHPPGPELPSRCLLHQLCRTTSQRRTPGVDRGKDVSCYITNDDVGLVNYGSTLIR